MEMLVVDYGAGNLASVMKALRFVGAAPVTGAGADAIARAPAIVIPGVGHFAQTASIDACARDAVRAAIARGVPVLGICLGMQWLFEGSDEAPAVAGLGLFPGCCFNLRGRVCFPQLSTDRGQALAARPVPASWKAVENRPVPYKVPHVGWNTVESVGSAARLLDGIPHASFAYFTHTYAAPVVADTVATTSHGAPFTAVLERRHVFGAQFHPEKSGDAGLRLLANFVGIATGAR